MTTISETDPKRGCSGIEVGLKLILAMQIARTAIRAYRALPNDIGPDGQQYVVMASFLVHRGVFDPGAFASGFLSPFWPLLLAILQIGLSPAIWVIRAVNFTVWLLTLRVSFCLAGRLLPAEEAWLAVTMLALDDLHAFVRNAQYEVLLTFLVASAALLWLHAIETDKVLYCGLAGSAWALAYLTQGKLLILPLVLAAATALCRHGIKPAGHYWRLALVAMMPVIVTSLAYGVFNYHVHGHFYVTSCNGGFNLLIGNNAMATGTWMSLPADVAAGGNSIQDPFIRDAFYRHRAFDWIRENPVDFLVRLPPRKFYYLWALERKVNYLLLLLMVGGAAVLLRRAARTQSVLMSFMLLYFVSVHLVFFGAGRFRFPALPFAHVFAASFVGVLARKAVPVEIA